MRRRCSAAGHWANPFWNEGYKQNAVVEQARPGFGRTPIYGPNPFSESSQKNIALRAYFS